MTDRAHRVPALAVVAVLALGAVAGCTDSAGGSSAGAAGASSPAEASPSAGASSSPAPTLDPEVIARATAVQAAQQALSQTGRGTFTVDLVEGSADGVLPTIEGAYDFTVPSGRFTAVTEEADRTVTLRYRTRGGLAWSQVLYPGSPLAPDCWYQLGIDQGALALPSQVAALLYLQPDPAVAEDEAAAVAELGDVLNAVGLTALANLLTPASAATPTPVDVRIDGDGDDGRFTGWSVAGQDVLDALAGADLGPGAARELAVVRPAVAAATWRVTLDDVGEAGSAGSTGASAATAAPPAGRVLVAGATCS